MNVEKRTALLKALRYWAASFVFLAGFLYYKSSIPLGPLLIAGAATLLLTIGKVYFGKPV